jgi:tetratricopeptide (TPR) repeat protein
MTEINAQQLEKIRQGELKLSEILPVQSDQIAAVLLVGHIFYLQGRTDDAHKIFEGLHVLDSKNPFINAMLGSIYQKRGMFDRALQHYDHAISVFPQDIQSRTNRGEIFLRFGKLKEAAAELKAAIDFDPERKNPAANRARLLAELARQSLTAVRDHGTSASREQLEASLTARN